MMEQPVTQMGSRPSSLFDTLRAEEETFLPDCYVPPAEFAMMSGTRSAVILGQTGSGKTALAQAVERHLNPPGAPRRFLVVPWTLPMLMDSELSGLALVLAQVGRVMDLVARALVEHLACYPADWQAAPPWCRERLHWFIREHLEGDVENLVQSLDEECAVGGQQLLTHLVESPPVQVLKPGAPPHLVMQRLLDAWKKMGYLGIVILMDGVEPWLLIAPDQLSSSLHAFLSTLPLFECPGFGFKLLLPARLELSLGSAGAALRGRVNWHKLEWSRAQLQEIVEKRLAVALNQESFSLDELAEKTDDGSAEKTGDEADKQAGDGTAEKTGDETAEKAGDEADKKTGDRTAEKAGDEADKKTGDRTAEKAGDEANKQTGDETAEKAGDETGEKGDRPTESRGLLDWLSRCGGELPRGWVGAVRPFLDAYIQAGRIPLSVEECAAIQERNPPRLYINPDTGEILVGHRPVAELTEGLDAVLHHLYRQRGRVCSRRDLYLTYMDALYPDRERKSVLTASDYGGVMDTVIYRLRQAVEPDPHNPVHIVTIKRRGVRLDNTL